MSLSQAHFQANILLFEICFKIIKSLINLELYQLIHNRFKQLKQVFSICVWTSRYILRLSQTALKLSNPTGHQYNLELTYEQKVFLSYKSSNLFATLTESCKDYTTRQVVKCGIYRRAQNCSHCNCNFLFYFLLRVGNKLLEKVC